MSYQLPFIPQGDSISIWKPPARLKVAVSGYFNVLHNGHLDLFELAAKLGDLYVVVNNDEQVRLKGTVPFYNESIRLRIVKSLRMVTDAFLSIDTEDTSITKTLREVKPQLFINSGDRQQGNLNEKELAACKEIGCEYMCLLQDKVESSSQIIQNAIDWYWQSQVKGVRIVKT